MTRRGISRRQFIERTAVGVVTVGLGAPLLRGETHDDNEERAKIVYRTLGRTKLRLPVVSFGVMNSDSPDLVRKALDMGVRHLDTAHVYLRGNSEKVIGRILEERGDRDKVCVGTKMRFARDRNKGVFVTEGSAREPGATAKNLREQLEKSLERLRTDYVDILYLHSCYTPAMVTYEPMMKALTKVKEEGKARFIGVSTHSNEADCIRAAVDTKVWDVVLTSYNYMQKNREEVRQAIAYAAKEDVGIVAMKTQGGVRLNRQSDAQVNHAAALKWVLNDENVCTTIPGITAFEQLDLDFGVMKDLGLTKEEKRDLEISALVRGPFYCQSCRTCISSCPKRVEIPTLMRSYMYAEGYGNLMQAEDTMAALPSDQSLHVCQSCSECTALCPNGIEIGERLNSLLAMNLIGDTLL
jgi:predicted aldo/keto reductase-like oxidoreductase